MPVFAWRLAQTAFGACSALAVLSGCSNAGAPQLSPSGAAITSVLSPEARAHLAVPSTGGLTPHPLDRLAKGSKLMLISDYGFNQVYVFKYPSGQYVGTLPEPKEGFAQVDGLCSDNNGNIFVTNTGHSTIDKYTSGAFVKALQDPGMSPVGCSVDPTTNTLAVDNLYSTSYGQGGISLYAKESGPPRQLFDPDMYEAYFSAYFGRTGELFFSGMNDDNQAAVSSYINGKFKLFPIKGVSLGFPGTVAYSVTTKSLLIGDQNTFSGPTFYQVRHAGNVIGKIVLQCPSGFCDIPQAAVKGYHFLGPDASSLTAGLYHYPSGDFITSVSGASFAEPVGSAFSFVK